MYSYISLSVLFYLLSVSFFIFLFLYLVILSFCILLSLSFDILIFLFLYHFILNFKYLFIFLLVYILVSFFCICNSPFIFLQIAIVKVWICSFCIFISFSSCIFLSLSFCIFIFFSFLQSIHALYIFLFIGYTIALKKCYVQLKQLWAISVWLFLRTSKKLS